MVRGRNVTVSRDIRLDFALKYGRIRRIYITHEERAYPDPNTFWLLLGGMFEHTLGATTRIWLAHPQKGVDTPIAQISYPDCLMAWEKISTDASGVYPLFGASTDDDVQFLPLIISDECILIFHAGTAADYANFLVLEWSPPTRVRPIPEV